MSMRIRVVDGVTVALCAARSVAKPGDVYLDDAHHYALSQKFSRDFVEMGFIVGHDLINAESAAIVEVEESNNPNRTWWDKTYGPDTASVEGVNHA